MCFFRKTLLSVCIVLPCAAFAQPLAADDNASTNEETQVVFDILSNDDASPNSIDPLSVDLDPSTPLSDEKLISIAEGDFEVDNSGMVTFTPALNFNGDAIISYTIKNDEVTPQTSAPATITVTVMPINDPPSFTKGGDQTVNEDAGPQTVLTWATNIIDGDDGSQELTFDVSNDNMALFTPGGQPSITSSGDLSYEPAANASGSATVSVVLTDDGGDVPPNVNTSGGETFEITVDALNDAPVFTPGSDVTVYENTGPQTISAWATGIDDGDPESDQGLNFIVNNNNSALFLVQPAISELTGDLTFEIAADAFGTATVSVTLEDDGPAVAPDVNTSGSQMFDITVNPINNAPSFTKGPDESILEDAGPQTVVNWATNIMDGDDGSQGLLFVVDNDNGALFSTPPSITPDGDLSYEVAGNASGSAVVTVTLMDDGDDVLPSVNVSAEQTFNITVSPLNDAPVFIAGSNVSVYGSAPQTVTSWATSIDDGDLESDQNLSFTLDTDNNALFLVLPAISEVTGDLTFTPAVSANGSATVTVTLVDDGSNVPPHVNTSAPLDFTITIDVVNHPPTFTAGPDQTVDEDAGAQTVSSWATGIDDGDAGVSQVLTFDVTNTNNGLFSTQPAIDEITGTLTYTPGANAYGSATVTVILSDDGADTPAPNNNTSASQEFTITISPINDAPVFAKGLDQVVDEDAGLQTVPGWAAGIDDGDAGVSQTLTFAVTNDNNSLFSTQPAIDAATGTLTYRPADNANGSATVSVILNDDGSGVAPNVNATVAQTFFINVNAIDDTPTIESLMNQTIDENTETGPLSVIIGDVETPPNLLTLIPLSSNTGLVDNTGLVLGGMGSMRSVNVIPKFNEFGMTIITLRVTDEGGNSTETEFQVFVNEVDLAPTISAIADQVINEDTPSAVLPFTTSAGVTVSGTSDNQALISNGQITIGGSGTDWTVQFTPEPNANSPALGDAVITIDVFDGVDHTFEDFTVTVNAVNDVPSFTKGADQSVNEDALPQTVNGWATNIEDGDDDVVQGLTFIVNTNNNSLFSALPAITPGGDLSYTPAANATGTATVTVTLEDDGGQAPPNLYQSASQTFDITLTPLNDAPVFTPGTNVMVDEGAGAQTINSWATSIDDGDPEFTQTVSFTVGNNNNALFLVQPAISAAGNLTFTPAVGANGSATVTVTLVDNGSGIAPNVNSSAPVNFTITVNAINDPPVFTAGANQVVNEDAGAQTVAGWATGIDDGDLGVTQVLTFIVSNNNTTLFATQPSLSAAGTLTYMPANNANGIATVTVTLSDNGASAPPPNDNTSAPQMFTITINPINDVPTFTKGADQAANENAALQTVAGWATGIDDGDPELTQTLTFNVNNDNNALFVVQPSINASGDLTYRPATNANGSAMVSVSLSDNGSSAAPNVNTSAVQTFMITINNINNPPVFTAGANQTVDEDAGLQTVANWATGIDDGDPDVTQTLTFNVSNDNNVLFSDQPTINASGTLSYTAATNANGVANITVVLTDNGAGSPPPNSNTSAPQMFTITVNAINDPPTISSIGNTIINEDSQTGTIPFSISDPETAAGSLIVSASSDNTTLVPNANIVLAGSGGARTVNVMPAPDENGVVNITITVSDGTNTAMTSFQVTVNAVNDAPVITAQVPITIDEVEPVVLSVTQLTIVDPDDIYPGGFELFVLGGANYSVVGTTVTPIPNFSGILTVPVFVNDGEASSFPPFNLQITVNSTNDAPVITGQQAITINEDQTYSVGFGDLTVNDPDNTYPDDFTLSLSPGPNYTFTGTTVTPAANYNGTLLVNVIVNDGSVNSNPFSLQISITPVNDPPVITAQSPLSTNEDTPLPLVVGNFTVVDPEPTTYTLTVDPTPGTNYTVSGNTVTPNPDFFGTISVPVTVSDGTVSSVVFNAQITVNSVNDAPVITGQTSLTTVEDTPITLKLTDLTVTDVDNPGYPTGFSLNVQAGSDYTFSGTTVTPGPDYVGPIFVSVRVNDGTTNSAPYLVQIDVTDDSDAPIITGQNVVSMDEDESLELTTANLEIEDPDTPDNQQTLIVLDGPNYTVDGTTISPNPNYFGTLTVNVQVNDGTASSNIFPLQVTVNPVNDAPSFSAIANVTILEDAAQQSLVINNISAGPLETTQTMLFQMSSSNTDLMDAPTFTYNGTASMVTIMFKPKPNMFGTTTITVTLVDNNFLEFTREFTITVTSVNDKPTIAQVAPLSFNEGAPLQIIPLTGITAGGGPSESNQTLELIVLSVTNGELLENQPSITYQSPQTTGSLNVLPEVNAFGTVTITLQLKDSGPGSPPPNVNTTTMTVTIVINPVNDAPEFDSDPPMQAEVGVMYQYNIEVSDVDNETITITAPTKPGWLTLTQGTNGKATLSGMPLTSETVQVILEAKDPSGATTPQAYMLTVNSRPVVSPISITLNEDEPYNFSAEDFASGFFDADGNTIAEIEITALPTRGTLRLNNVAVTVGAKIQVSIFGTLTYVPKTDSVGMDSFKWNGADGLGLYALTDTDANITVNPINDPPIITVLETDSLHYELGSEVPVFMTTTFDAYDPDKGDLITSAEITFLRLGDFQFSEDNDVLIFPTTPKIQGEFKSGVLRLSGSATAAEYVAAIRSIKYNFEDTKEIIDEPRGISITLSDGKAQSLSKTRIIKLIYTFSDLDIPTAFTPNGDFANESWHITSLNGTDQYSDAEIKVYNKRGLLVFDGTGFEIPWNGVFNGEVLPADTYFYTIDLKYNRVRYKGTVTILR